MSIWNRQYTVEELRDKGNGTMVEHLGIAITEIGDDFLKELCPSIIGPFSPWESYTAALL